MEKAEKKEKKLAVELKKEEIGARVKKLREQEKVRSQELADYLGVHRSHYFSMEAGRILTFTPVQLVNVRDFFEKRGRRISLDFLVEGRELIAEEATDKGNLVELLRRQIEELKEERQRLIENHAQSQSMNEKLLGLLAK